MAGAYIKDHVCVKCLVGYYQDLPAQTSCKGCPDGYTTSDTGTVTATECSVFLTTSRDGGQLFGMGTAMTIVCSVAVCVVVALGAVAVYIIYQKNKYVSVGTNSKRCDTPDRPPTRVAWI
ncbi:hypothetical protein NP493_541g02002 [Ridgeia piscesae]|uniref:Tyrosine-protein kinase ephrin type A/B receptor-like domain-containing protein n=1 Tax=Ridgeia piscesae TaxID=27915 RepID=A0AAD9KW98_RIDPI|nr:hypothetical protein NP493_541g02002 [Ridgeia piscesae]